MTTPIVSPGLDNVIVAETRLSEVDGLNGHLIIGGFDVETLAANHPFEAAAHLLLTGALPTDDQLADLRARLGAARRDASTRLADNPTPLAIPNGMDALQCVAAATPEALRDDPVAAIATLAVTTAAWVRRRAGLAPLPADPAAHHAHDLLRMATGDADPARARALDAYLTTVIDHGLNASTFTARVVASTGADLSNAVSAAVGALKGPLHGGAPGPVLDMLDAIAHPDHADAWLRAELDAGRRIMGLGHRVYRTRDPRAAVLEAQLRRLAADTPTPPGRIALANAVEAAATAILASRYPDRPLRANVEFYTATLLEAVGLPRDAFALTFAASRVAGWCAHVHEQRRLGRLIRPASRYTGPRP